MQAFLSYEGLPIKSGGGHSMGKKTPDEVYSNVKAFLASYTNAVLPEFFDLTFYSSQQKAYKTLPHLWRLVKIFGIPTWKWWNLEVRQHLFNWKIRSAKLDAAFKQLETFSQLPENPFGPLVLSIKWQFYFTEPRTASILPGQQQLPLIDFRNQNSQLYMRLGKRSTISVWFAFPFEVIDDNCKHYLASVVKALPFKPSEKHWRLWKLSKNYNWIPKSINIDLP